MRSPGKSGQKVERTSAKGPQICSWLSWCIGLCRQAVSTRSKETTRHHVYTEGFKLEPEEQIWLRQRGLGKEHLAVVTAKAKMGDQY
jgi:hypothetical protein